MPNPLANGRWAFLAIIAIAVAVYGYHRGVFSGAPEDNSSAIQSNIGASSCSSSGYYLTNKLDGSRQIIYDCQMPDGSYKCVTESGGVDSDSTATVSLVFANTLGATKPVCAG